MTDFVHLQTMLFTLFGTRSIMNCIMQFTGCQRKNITSLQWNMQKVSIKDVENDKNIKVIKTSISDDGTSLRESNWTVVWYDDEVQITLRGTEQEDANYTVALT